jgi:hypothetical protein
MPGPLSTARVDPAWAQEIAVVLETLDRWAPPGEPILAFPEPLFYLLTRRPPPVRQLFFAMGWVTRANDAAVVQALGDRGVNWVVFHDFQGLTRYGYDWPHLWHELDAAFRVVARSPSITLWRRKDRLSDRGRAMRQRLPRGSAGAAGGRDPSGDLSGRPARTGT